MRDYDVLVVGAGFGGLHALYHLRNAGYRVLVVEAGDGPGGTWYWNRYPGARCDVVSIDYSYTFSEELYQEWDWSERYAQQPEIERYVNWVTDRLDLRRDIRFNARVVSAVYDEDDPGWTIETESGDSWSAQFLVAATGCLSVPNVPEFEGLDRFAGDVYHTAKWPKDAKIAGRRVAVIGTGSSGTQAVPVIDETAAELTVFQRTANFSLPAGQTAIDQERVRQRKASLAEWREAAWNNWSGFDFQPGVLAIPLALDEDHTEVYAELDRRWTKGGLPEILFAFEGVFSDLDRNHFLAEYFRRKVREEVDDPEVAELLCAKDHPIGTKRLCADSFYHETFNQEHVSLVDVRSAPIASFDETGLVLSDGRRFEFDVVVLATGFDAMTGPLKRMGVRGRDGRTIEQAWADGPHTYLGLQVAGFPNLFMITGPQSPSVLINMLMAIEQHVRWITDCIDHMRANGLRSIEATPAAQVAWDEEVRTAANGTLYPQTDSWYMGANIPGKPRVFMVYVGGFDEYREKCDAVAAAGYEGFAIDAVPALAD
jgi:cation diffusion facilitator CzcD-associated flavoprotein CzcO